MKLSNIRNKGRYQFPNEKRCVNIKVGRKKGYGVDVLFYLYRGKKIYISDYEFSKMKEVW